MYQWIITKRRSKRSVSVEKFKKNPYLFFFILLIFYSSSKVALAFIPGGTGNSFVLELQDSFSSRKAIKRVLRGMVAPVDILEMDFPYAQANQPSKIFSFNGLHWGMASRVSHVAEKYRWMGSASRYTTAVMKEVFKGEMIRAKISFETKGTRNFMENSKLIYK